jgi:thiosulfate/3-mercaptopyruvate sulfurtransferase
MTARRLLVSMVLCLAAPMAAKAAATVPAPLVSTAWLQQHLKTEGLVVLDIRAAPAFAAAHIPGSLQTDYPGVWRAERDGVPWVAPDFTDLERALGALGIGIGSTVVVVPAGSDASEVGGATWIYWLLKRAGHADVAILDGGWRAWADEGRPTGRGPAPAPRPAAFAATPDDTILATTEHVLARLEEATLIDARSPPQYAGQAQTALVVASRTHRSSENPINSLRLG